VPVTAVSTPPATGTDRAAARAPRGRRSPHLATLGLLAPALLPVLAFSVAPLLYGIFLGFTDARAGYNMPVTVTGFDNYVELFGDADFWGSFRVGLVWAVSVTVLQFAASTGLALLLNMRLRGRWLARTLTLVPWAMPPVVVGLMWRLVYHPQAGILNSTLRSLHLISTNVDWLDSFALALPAVIVVGVWSGMPQTTIALLAGLQAVPTELTEAAVVDGASSWQRFRSVTLPALRPVITAITSLDFIWNINQFGLVYVLTQGGPGGRTRLPMLFAYQEAFRYGFFGYAASLGVAIVLVVLALLAFYLRRQLKEAS
ncbi:MAG: sugar ABC transporter permease, partial [Actinocatenispora sp.]